MPKAKTGPKPKLGNIVLPNSDAPTLSDLGISKSQSSRWQSIASLPETVFEEHIAETKAEKDGELTSAGAANRKPPLWHRCHKGGFPMNKRNPRKRMLRSRATLLARLLV